MPNPFTRHINKGDQDANLAKFIELWDLVEDLLVDVYRSGEPSGRDEKTWAEVRTALKSAYPLVKVYLTDPAGSQNRAEGEGAFDPVLEVLKTESLTDMIATRRVLQLLPDIREIINRALLK